MYGDRKCVSVQTIACTLRITRSLDLFVSRIFRTLDIFFPQAKMWREIHWGWQDGRNSLNYWINFNSVNCNILSSEHFRNWLISVWFITERIGIPVRTVIMRRIRKTGQSGQRFFFLTSVSNSALESIKTLILRASTWRRARTSFRRQLPLHKHRDTISLTSFVKYGSTCLTEQMFVRRNITNIEHSFRHVIDTNYLWLHT
jgi:hypothetical protein